MLSIIHAQNEEGHFLNFCINNLCDALLVNRFCSTFYCGSQICENFELAHSKNQFTRIFYRYIAWAILLLRSSFLFFQRAFRQIFSTRGKYT